MTISFTLMMIVSVLTMNTRDLSFRFRIYAMQFIAGLCASALCYILDKLFNKKLELSGDDDLDTGDDNGHNYFGLQPGIYTLVLFILGFFAGIVLSRLLLMIHLICK